MGLGKDACEQRMEEYEDLDRAQHVALPRWGFCAERSGSFEFRSGSSWLRYAFFRNRKTHLHRAILPTNAPRAPSPRSRVRPNLFSWLLRTRPYHPLLPTVLRRSPCIAIWNAYPRQTLVFQHVLISIELELVTTFIRLQHGGSKEGRFR